MPNKLERSLKYCGVDMVRQSYRALLRTGLSEDQAADIFDELEGWLAWKEHPSPDIWEGEKGWYRVFSGGGFVIEGEAGQTCPARVVRKRGWKPKEGAVDLDCPETWRKRPKQK